MTEIRSTYYRGRDGQDLFDRFEAGLLSREETIGFYKGNAIKYLIREDDKNGEEDLDKALTYIGRLKQFKYSKNPMAKVGITTDEAQRHVHVGGNGNGRFSNTNYWRLDWYRNWFSRKPYCG